MVTTFSSRKSRVAWLLSVFVAIFVVSSCSDGSVREVPSATEHSCADYSPEKLGLPGDGATASQAAETVTVGAEENIPEFLAQNCLRINQIQVMGSHNSYHIQGKEPLWSALEAFDADLAASLEYSHSPLSQQFSDEGIRQIELDVFADPDGGRFADRHLGGLLGVPIASGIPELDLPGFKVFHVQEVDYETTCLTLVDCLNQVKSWSDANTSHLPIAILLELKEDVIPDPVNAGFVQPIPYTTALLDALDAEIRSVFAEDKMITPDDVRGNATTLEAAVLNDGWPTLAEARGQVMFLMDNEGASRDAYLVEHASLAGRVLFTNAAPGNADAAFVKMNDPTGENVAAIQAVVRKGYLVRTRTDVDTVQARTGDTVQRDAALASGAQWLSTDYPVVGRAETFGTNYVAKIPGGSPARCNPIMAGLACRNDLLEL